MTVLLCVLLALSFTACSQKPNEDDNPKPDNGNQVETLATPRIDMRGSLTDVNGIEVVVNDEEGKAEKYEIYMSDKADGEFTLVATIEPDGCYSYNFTEEEVKNEIHYFFKACGIKGSVKSEMSNVGEFGPMK